MQKKYLGKSMKRKEENTGLAAALTGADIINIV